MENLATDLEGELVRLEPLRDDHAEGLWRAAQAPEIWSWLPRLGESREKFEPWFRAAVASTAAGEEAAFATVDRRAGSVVGSSSYLNVRDRDRVVEIGWTWLHPSAWGRGLNVEAKMLMLEHAFSDLGCLRVEFKTDARNERSRAALAALPARFEGVMRKAHTMPDVGTRDSAYYSVVDDEWPQVRDSLRRRLAAKLGS